MGFRGIPGYGPQIQRLVIIVLLNTCLFNLPGETDPRLLDVVISPNPVAVNGTFSVSFVIDHDSIAGIKMENRGIYDGFSYYGGPSYRLKSEEESNRGLKRVLNITIIYRAKETGWKVLPPFNISLDDNSTLQTPEILIGIGVNKGGSVIVPIEVEWVFSKTEPYLGEAVPLMLMVKNYDGIDLFTEADFTPPQGGFFEKIDNFGTIVQKSIQGRILYDLPVSAFMFTPSVSGKIRLPAMTIKKEGNMGTSSAPVLNVREIPAGISGTGAIGNFSLWSDISGSRVMVNETIYLKIRLSGEGNLNYLIIPEPLFDNLVLTEKNERNDIKATPSGYLGAREIEYSLLCDNPFPARIVIPPFHFLNTENETIEIIPGRTIPLEILPAGSEPGSSRNGFVLIEKNTAMYMGHKQGYIDPLSYILLLPGILFFLVSLIKFRKRGKLGFIAVILMMNSAVPDFSGSEVIAKAYNDFDAGNYIPAAREFLLLSRNFPNNSAFLYNAAVNYFLAGNTGMAIHLLRSAIYIHPQNNLYRETLDEFQSGIKYPLAAPFPIQPDLFFFIAVAAFNLTMISLGIFIRFRKAVLFVVMVLLAGVTVLATGALIYMHITRSIVSGTIVGEDAAMKKIPVVSGTDVYSLNDGQTVSIMGESGQFYLVQTPYGLKGWINRENVFLDRDLSGYTENSGLMLEEETINE